MVGTLQIVKIKTLKFNNKVSTKPIILKLILDSDTKKERDYKINSILTIVCWFLPSSLKGTTKFIFKDFFSLKTLIHQTILCTKFFR